MLQACDRSSYSPLRYSTQRHGTQRHTLYIILRQYIYTCMSLSLSLHPCLFPPPSLHPSLSHTLLQAVESSCQALSASSSLLLSRLSSPLCSEQLVETCCHLATAVEKLCHTAQVGLSDCYPSIYLYVCLPICLSVCLSAYLSVCPFVCLFVCLFILPLSVCLSVCLSVYLLACLFLSSYLPPSLPPSFP